MQNPFTEEHCQEPLGKGIACPSYDNDDRIIEETTVFDAETGPIRVQTEYDKLGRVSKTYNQFTNTGVSYQYDNLDRVIQEDFIGHSTIIGTPEASFRTSTKYEYNASGDMTARIEVDPDNENNLQRTSYFYDTFGYQVAVKDARDQWTLFYRDGLGNMLELHEIVDVDYTDDGYPLKYNKIINKAAYDSLGNVISRTDDHNHTTLFKRNIYGEIFEVERPDGTTKTFTLNREGAITGIVDWEGRVFQMELDRFNRPLKVREDGTLFQEYTYDGIGNIIWAKDINLGNDSVISVEVSRQMDTFGNLLFDEILIADSEGEQVSRTTASYQGPRLTGLTTPSEKMIKITYTRKVLMCSSAE